MTADDGGEGEQLRLVAVGDVDHGKSTLIGRLLARSGRVSPARIQEIEMASKRRGVPFEWSFLLDSLQSERDQAVTIDTTRVWLKIGGRNVVLIDAPGHEQFLRNMISGASDADAAILVVDATTGVQEQTYRHLLVLDLLGIRNCVVAINKIDAVDFDKTLESKIRTTLESRLKHLSVDVTAYVGVSAKDGTNIDRLEEAIAALKPASRSASEATRFFVQGVQRVNGRRIALGELVSGRARSGDLLTALPSQERVQVATVARWPAASDEPAKQGESIGLEFAGNVFLHRGDLLVSERLAPTLRRRFLARLVWLANEPAKAGNEYALRIGTRRAGLRLESIERVLDVVTLEPRNTLEANAGDLVEMILHSNELLAIDDPPIVAATSRLLLIKDTNTVAVGTAVRVLSDQPESRLLFPSPQAISRAVRERANGHRGAVVWLTGLPAAGKSTLAKRAELQLFESGRHVMVLDGDNVRSGLCSDLGFSASDRTENMRRIAEVARLCAESGAVVIAAFISPLKKQRETARQIVRDNFHEVFVKADPEVCERRDPKGLYKLARSGALKNFTGTDGSYEQPDPATPTIDTTTATVEQSVAEFMRYVNEVIVL